MLDGESQYYGVMPFNRSLADIEDRIRSRAASVDPVSTYRRAYTTATPYGATTSFDYKVSKATCFKGLPTLMLDINVF